MSNERSAIIQLLKTHQMPVAGVVQHHGHNRVFTVSVGQADTDTPVDVVAYVDALRARYVVLGTSALKKDWLPDSPTVQAHITVKPKPRLVDPLPPRAIVPAAVRAQRRAQATSDMVRARMGTGSDVSITLPPRSGVAGLLPAPKPQRKSTSDTPVGGVLWTMSDGRVVVRLPNSSAGVIRWEIVDTKDMTNRVDIA